MKGQAYVLGLAFTPNKTAVALIEKRHGPACLIGKWNGVGGKVEPGESTIDAMVREFKEETGVEIRKEMWDMFLTLRTNADEVIHVFRSFHVAVLKVLTTTDETVELVDRARLEAYPVEHFPRLVTPFNLSWIIPMALNSDIYMAEVSEQ